MNEVVRLDPEVDAALRSGAPVVALETTFLVHGLPTPHNLETAAEIETIIREQGVVPAFIGIIQGQIRVGLEMTVLDDMTRTGEAEKASRRDLAALLASGKSGATTVAGTMVCAALAGIEVFATGGIGGVHRDYESTLDVSADLTELGRTRVAVVCSGAKSILDLPRTLEFLETQGVPVVGYGVKKLPAFYLRDCGLEVDYKVDTPLEAANLIVTNRRLGGPGMMIANPIPASSAVNPDVFERWLEAAVDDASSAGVKGKLVTPFLLDRIFELSGGAGLKANKSLLIENARVGALIAHAVAALSAESQ